MMFDSFIQATHPVESPERCVPRFAVGLADLNADGALDIVFGNAAGSPSKDWLRDADTQERRPAKLSSVTRDTATPPHL